MTKQVKYLDQAGLSTLYGLVDKKIADALKAKIESLDSTKGESAVADGKHIAVEVVETDGVITAVNVKENDIASEAALAAEVSRATAAEKANADAIAAMAVDDHSVDGQFVTAVSQTAGKITVSRGGVTADKVTTTAVAGGADTVAIEGTNVDAQIKSLGKTLKSVEGNAAKYKVVKLTDTEVTDLKDANVKEAYKVVSYVGAETEHTAYTQVGDVIKIYKDAHLEKAELGTGNDAQKLILTYNLANGKQSVVEVDFAAIAFNSEFKNGLQVSGNGEVSVKIDAASESYLTVGADGIKLAGVKNAIDDAVAAKNVTATGDDYITVNAANNNVTVSAGVQGLTVDKAGAADSTLAGVEKSLVDGKEVADKVSAFTNARIGEEVAKLDADVTSDVNVSEGVAHKVRVQVVETDGKVSAVNVTENDIASDAALTAEVNRAKAAEDKIEQSVGLNPDGTFTAPTTTNYATTATSVMDAIAKLDAQIKINADTISGRGSVNEDTQTIEIDGKGLQFVALTSAEITSGFAATPKV